ncbi:MAG: hypothetical protein WBK76_03365 [Candidatus Saccharimonadales bacterium]|nr:hypothetical protein [Patescibacteria group bacterium]
MKNTQPIVKRNIAFVILVAMTGAILLIPLLAMQLSGDVYWSVSDFVIAGSLLLGVGSVVLVLSRNSRLGKYWLAWVVAGFGFVVWLWAELAVGIFTNWGS